MEYRIALFVVEGDKMQLDLTNKEAVEKYNEFVRNSDYGSLMQDIGWSIVKNTWKNAYFYIEENGEIVGALSVIYIHDSSVDSNFYYAPRGPVCDINNIELVKKLIEEARDRKSVV